MKSRSQTQRTVGIIGFVISALLCSTLFLPANACGQDRATPGALKKLIADMGYQNVVVEMSDDTTAVIADIDEAGVSTQVVGMVLAAHVSNPAAGSVYVGLTWETVLVGYVEVPAESLRIAKVEEDPTRLFDSWNFVALSAPHQPAVDPESIEVNLDLADIASDPVVAGAGPLELAPVADSHVYANDFKKWSESNWGAYEILSAGWHPTGGEKRAFLKFDVSMLDAEKVAGARLRLYHYITAGAASLDLGVHEVTAEWSEGVGTFPPESGVLARPGEITWSAQPAYAEEPAVTFNPGDEGNQFVEVDVTPIVKGWLAGKPNHGLAVAPVGELSTTVQQSGYGFFAREREDERKRPVLVIEFVQGDTPVPEE